ncbi:hypothetical protein [Pseudoruegeria sp. SHC-113]|uniref:hypothetical protein n=1 Tax=Pseudoruegeria sp. SHC-113 TaxID=2855439 RepID=UPI0021BB3B7F|nr:hypothetical protein [Pseudoruegeria sp. SHC-113]MCT8159520.1 hypothetical protein [Pseudoruegeria sp. SHC-113]
MSRWAEQFEGHQIHNSLAQLREWLNVNVEQIDSEHEVERRRFFKTLDAIGVSLSEVDPELFPLLPLTQLDQQLRQAQVWSNLKTYSSSPSVQQLRAANDFLADKLHPFVGLMFSRNATGVTPKLREIEKAYDKFCKAIETREKDFSSRIEQGETKLAEVEKATSKLKLALSDLEKQTDQAFSDWQGEFTTAQTTRAEEFSTNQIERRKQFDTALREWRDKSEAEVKSISSDHNKKLSDAFATFEERIKTHLLDAKAKHKDILEIHKLVGTDGVAGGYQKSAEDEHKAANTWRWVAMGSFIAAGLWLLLKYFMGFEANTDGSPNWPELLAAASLTFVFLGMGGYAARQSSVHRLTEQHMRWFALEVKAIDPFLSSLPDDIRFELKNQLTQKLFGQNRVTPEAKDGGIDPSAVKMISDVLKAAGRG